MTTWRAEGTRISVTEELIPTPQQGRLIVLDDLLDSVQVLAREPTASLQADRVEPELGFAIITLDMDVGWFVPIA